MVGLETLQLGKSRDEEPWHSERKKKQNKRQTVGHKWCVLMLQF